MNFSSNIAKKFMFSSKETGPTRITGIIAVVGIAVGTMAMILSVSVLNGFESKIIDRIILPPKSSALPARKRQII